MKEVPLSPRERNSARRLARGAHAIGNCIAVVQLQTALLRARFPQDASLARELDDLARAAARAGALCRRLGRYQVSRRAAEFPASS
jgi:hypothetical protein